MLRGVAYILLGWLLLALEGGLAEVLSLTLMLPATSAVVITHAAFAREVSTPLGLAAAVALGYLEDLHQGAPVGLLSLAYGITFLALRWSARRIHLHGWLLQALASLIGAAIVDLLTLMLLLGLSESLGVRREAVFAAPLRWHGLATLLAAPPVWALLDRVFGWLHFDDGFAPSGPGGP